MTLSLFLPRDWYERDVVRIARELLGMILVRELDGQSVRCRIVETEAYRGEEDLACHARVGRTPRTAVMYGPAGHAYVYFTYGMHWCLNVVCMPEDYPAAVLIRAVEPFNGLDGISVRRAGRPQAEWTNGPAKLTQALRIDGSLNGVALTTPDGGLWIEAGEPAPDELVMVGPRVGIQNVPEPWRSLPWRFKVVSPAVGAGQKESSR